MPDFKKIDHVSLVVEDVDNALAFWRDTLGLELHHTQDVPTEGARVAFLPVGESEIELVQPTTPDSGIRRFLEKRGEGMHHICLEVEHLDDLLLCLKEKGVQVLNETPRQTAEGKRYIFIHPKSAHGVLVELYEMTHGNS